VGEEVDRVHDNINVEFESEDEEEVGGGGSDRESFEPTAVILFNSNISGLSFYYCCNSSLHFYLDEMK